MKKNISMLLLTVLLLSTLCPTLVACKKGEETKGENGTTGTIVSEDEYNGLEAVDYDGKQINFLTFALSDNKLLKTANDISGDSTGDPVQRAVYERNVTMQEKYNITINYVESGGGNLGPVGEAEKHCTSGTGEIDYVLAGSLANFMCGIRGYTVSAQSIPHIQLDKEWWYDDFMDETRISGKNFFIMGDFAYTTWSNSSATNFNEDLARTWKIDPEEIYDLVRDGKWTFEKFRTYCQMVYEDTDATIVGPSGGDTFGYFGSDIMVDALVAGSNFTFLKEQSDGSLKFGVKKSFSDFYDEISSFCRDETTMYVSAIDKTWDSAPNPYLDNRAVFYIATLPYKDDASLREVEFKYMYLPVPKYTETQDKYYSCHHAFNSASIAIIKGQDLDMLGRIIEDFTFYSMKTVRPAYYETLLEGMMAGSETFIEMLDYIVGVYCIDRASLFAREGVDLYDGSAGAIRYAVNSNAGYSSLTNKMTKWQGQVDKIVADINAME